MESAPSNAMELPLPILERVMLQLSDVSLACFAQSCRTGREASLSPSFWRARCQHAFGDVTEWCDWQTSDAAGCFATAAYSHLAPTSSRCLQAFCHPQLLGLSSAHLLTCLQYQGRVPCSAASSETYRPLAVSGDWQVWQAPPGVLHLGGGSPAADAGQGLRSGPTPHRACKGQRARSVDAGTGRRRQDMCPA